MDYEEFDEECCEEFEEFDEDDLDADAFDDEFDDDMDEEDEFDEDFDDDFYDEFDELEEEAEDEFDEFFEEAYDHFDALAEADLDDEEAEDEFIGALAGLAAKALPRIASKVVPKVMKWGRSLFRSRRTIGRNVVRKAPSMLRKATKTMSRLQRPIRRNPRIASRILKKKTRPYLRKYGRIRKYPGYGRRRTGRYPVSKYRRRYPLRRPVSKYRRLRRYPVGLKRHPHRLRKYPSRLRRQSYLRRYPYLRKYPYRRRYPHRGRYPYLRRYPHRVVRRPYYQRPSMRYGRRVYRGRVYGRPYPIRRTYGRGLYRPRTSAFRPRPWHAGRKPYLPYRPYSPATPAYRIRHGHGYYPWRHPVSGRRMVCRPA